jgi:outer membrane protein assembly factor BamB
MHVEEQQLAPVSVLEPAAPAPALRPRLWPLVVLVTAYWAWVIGSHWLELALFTRFITRLASGALVVLLFLVVWWATRRIPLRDRLYGFVVVVAGGVVTVPFLHPSSGGLGALMGPIEIVLTVWLLWLLLARTASSFVWRCGLLASVSLAWGSLLLVRMDGLTGDLRPAFHWRWAPTPEEAFRAEHEQRAGERTEAGLPAGGGPALSLTAGDWPGFRGPHSDGTVRGLSIDTDWYAHPPRLIWKRRVGPAWSSVVVVDGRLFTQEQRDNQEAVVCYDAGTGKELWAHEDAGRFWEPTAGAGPRATPCFAGGRLFAVGATGIVNCLDAATGKVHWTHDIKDDSGAKVPGWGYSSSPLVVGGLVLVFAGGAGEKNLLAYRVGSGELAWTAAAGETSYASPQPAKLQGQHQVLLFSNRGLVAVEPVRGKVLWEHPLPLPPSAPRSVQPVVVDETGVLIASEGDLGLALLDLKREGEVLTPTERWVSRKFRPSFNNFVVHQGHVYGFNGRIFACAELEEGGQKWQEGRYGHGQVLLLADQALLLVLSEEGEAILLRANPRKHEELGRFQAVKGKTWNDPVVAHGRLYIRNGEEMACYEL